jgi:hypothetical protein
MAFDLKGPLNVMRRAEFSASRSTAPHEFSNSSKFANFLESNRIRTLVLGLRIYGRFDSTKFANFEQVREPISSLFRKKGL